MKETMYKYLHKPIYVIPADFFALDVTKLELAVLIFIFNQKEVLFNPEFIGNQLSVSKVEVLKVIDSLQTKKLINITFKNKKEFVEMDGLIDEIIKMNQVENKHNLYQVFEHEFGRVLSPIEYEIINSWLSEKVSEDLIITALKEATFNGVKNLRYIDKILYDWKQKGYQKSADIAKKAVIPKEELFDYNWLDE